MRFPVAQLLNTRYSSEFAEVLKVESENVK